MSQPEFVLRSLQNSAACLHAAALTFLSIMFLNFKLAVECPKECSTGDGDVADGLVFFPVLGFSRQNWGGPEFWSCSNGSRTVMTENVLSLFVQLLPRSVPDSLSDHWRSCIKLWLDTKKCKCPIHKSNCSLKMFWRFRKSLVGFGILLPLNLYVIYGAATMRAGGFCLQDDPHDVPQVSMAAVKWVLRRFYRSSWEEQRAAILRVVLIVCWYLVLLFRERLVKGTATMGTS